VTEQADLHFAPAVGLVQTPAMRKRDDAAVIHQCSGCGALVARTSDAPGLLGPCPVCGERKTWWSQHVPVGPFRDPDHIALDRFITEHCEFRERHGWDMGLVREAWTEAMRRLRENRGGDEA
jgi:predicted  nucleic acid-binding Zn-ribbon protein